MTGERIGVVGTGSVGSTLGRRFADAGYEVRFGTRDPDREEVAELVEGTDASAGTVPEVADWADALVLAVPAGAVESVLSEAAGFDGVVIDPTNRYPDAGEESGFALVSRLAPDASVAKAFNTVGWEVMADPDLDGVAATMPVAGDDGAKTLALSLADDIGFEGVDIGGRATAERLEDLARVWIHLAVSGFGREFAFVLRSRR
jgi:hypothetical protein